MFTIAKIYMWQVFVSENEAHSSPN